MGALEDVERDSEKNAREESERDKAWQTQSRRGNRRGGKQALARSSARCHRRGSRRSSCGKGRRSSSCGSRKRGRHPCCCRGRERSCHESGVEQTVESARRSAHVACSDRVEELAEGEAEAGREVEHGWGVSGWDGSWSCGSRCGCCRGRRGRHALERRVGRGSIAKRRLHRGQFMCTCPVRAAVGSN